MPLVSIIVPVYNAEKYVERCIKSILMQTHHNVEVVIICDGSQDRSGDICENLARTDSRISIYHQKNSGVTAARLTGLHLSKGVYISFVDADDFIEPTYIEELLQPIVEGKTEMTCCQDFRTINGKDIIHRRKERGMMDRKRIERVIATDFIFDQKKKESGVPLFIRGKMMTREIAEIAIEGGRDMWFGEDAVGVFSVAYKINSMYILDKPLYHYVIHPGQTINKTGRKRWDANLKVWKKFLEIDTKKMLGIQLSYRVAFITRKYLNRQAKLASTYRNFHKEMSYALDNIFVKQCFLDVKTGRMTKTERFYNYMIRHRLDFIYYMLSKLRN